MSVYTSVSKQALGTFLENYPLGRLLDFQGISEGIENTNYFVTTSEGKFVLTIFELLTAKELPFYIELMAFLNEHNIPSAHPIADNHQHYLRMLNGKPAILMQRLHGKSVVNPTRHHCESIGKALAELHLQGESFKLVLGNSRGEQWRRTVGQQLLPLLSAADATLLKNELQDHTRVNYHRLPRGIVHADLFRDNVLFESNSLTGILDFYNACNDSLLYDVAITVNDWCITENGELDFERAQVLCQSYQSKRKPGSDEIELWPMMLRTAALRFWLSRLWSNYFPKDGALTFQKDPNAFRNIIIARINEGATLRDVW